MHRTFWLALAVVCATIATVSVALGGHLMHWVFYTWVWTSVLWAFSWWMAKGRIDADR